MLRILRSKNDFLMDTEEFARITGIAAEDLRRSIREIEYGRSHFELEDFKYNMDEVGVLLLATIFKDRIKDGIAEVIIKFIGLKKQQRYQEQLVEITNRLLKGSTLYCNAFLDLAKMQVPEGCNDSRQKELIELALKHLNPVIET